MRLNFLAAATLILLGLPLAHANPDVDAARKAYDQGDFHGALSRLQRAERSPALTEEELIEVYWYRGVSSFALHRGAQADQAFDALLDVRPLFLPDDTEAPPDIREAFEKRRKAHQAKFKLVLGIPRLEGNVLKLEVSGASSQPLHHVTAFVRAPGTRTFAQFQAPAAAGLVHVPIKDHQLVDSLEQAGSMEVVVEAQSAGNVPLARVGDAVAPLKVAVEVVDVPQPAVTSADPGKGKGHPRPSPNNSSAVPSNPVDNSPAAQKPEGAGAAGSGGMIKKAGAGAMVAAGPLGVLPLVLSAVGVVCTGLAYNILNGWLHTVGVAKNPAWPLARQVYTPLAVAVDVLAVLTVFTVPLALLGLGVAAGGLGWLLFQLRG